MDTSAQKLIELYIATFGRAPDATGLAFWQGHLSSGTLTLEKIALLFFDATETKERYPTTLSNGDFVDSVYTNVLNRPSEANGKAYWVDRLDKGSITKDGFILSFIEIASANEGTADQQLVNNKTTIGYYYAVTLKLDDTTLAFHAMESISSDINTITRTKADLETYSKATDFVYTQLDNYNNTYNGTASKDWVYGMAGDDTIYAADGANFVDGGLGDDILYGGKDNDTLHGNAGNDTLYGELGDDFLYGREGDDSLYGGDGKNTLYGDSGNDYIYGGIDADTIYGGLGNDRISSGLGDDRVYGEEGDDNIDVSDGANWVDAGSGSDIVYGGAGIDQLYGGSGDDTLFGFAGADILSGMTDNDTLYGGEDNDTLYGGEGNDTLYGDAGSDKLYGELGDDLLDGGLGADALTGGAGRDTFVFSALSSTLASMDTITDFIYSATTGDYLTLVDHGAESITTSKVSVTAAATLAAALDLASTGDGSTNAIIKWFTYQNNTYIVEDMSVNATYDATKDLIIKLQGVYDFSTLNSDVLSFV